MKVRSYIMANNIVFVVKVIEKFLIFHPLSCIPCAKYPIHFFLPSSLRHNLEYLRTDIMID